MSLWKSWLFRTVLFRKKVFEQLSSLENIPKIDSDIVKQLYYEDNQNAKKLFMSFVVT